MNLKVNTKFYLFTLGCFIIAGIFIQSTNIKNDEFIALLKAEHPPLIKNNRCGNKLKEIGDYKLVKINGVYFVKTKTSSYKPSDLSIYEYEEF